MGRRHVDAPRIYLCATEWIELLTGAEGAAAVEGLLERARAGHFAVVGSELLRAEVLHDGGIDLLDASVRIWVAMDRTVAMETRRIRLAERDRLDGEPQSRRTPDQIHVASALVAGAEVFISHDPGCRALAKRYDLHAVERDEYPDDELPAVRGH